MCMLVLHVHVVIINSLEWTGFSGLATSVVVLWLCGLAIIDHFPLRFSQSSYVGVPSFSHHSSRFSS